MTAETRQVGRRRVPGDWRSRPEEVAPTVLILGGFLTSPILYRLFRRRLIARGARAVVVANVWTPDWLIAGRRGLGAIATRAGRAMVVASQLSDASPESGGAPLLVVGHSAGGILARLLLVPEPFEGRRLGAVERVAAIVTLGTPHVVSSGARIGGRVASLAAAFADRCTPGAFYAPRVGYVAVGSRAVVGRAKGRGRERIAFRLYRDLLGDIDGGVLEGDGLVPIQSATLPGATPIVLDGIAHGPGSGQPWYGSDAAIDAWWPAALEAWRAAVCYRATELRAPQNR